MDDTKVRTIQLNEQIRTRSSVNKKDKFEKPSRPSVRAELPANAVRAKPALRVVYPWLDQRPLVRI